MAIEPGLVNEKVLVVSMEDTAAAGTAGELPAVLSTPRMISNLEKTAHQAIVPFLPEGQTSVGLVVNVRHMGATPVGMQVRFRAELIEVDRRRLRFKVEAWDEVEQIASGEHERFIIDRDRFEARLEEKRAAMGKEQ